ncbi:MAG: hypothetical protein PUP93_31010 [Rhizonema sp. NSF051]|nr:hypothetical protein [Rhizonema sp. NSF051]
MDTDLSDILDTGEFDELTTSSFEGLNDIAARTFPGQDVKRFNEITKLNPNLNIFGTIKAGTKLLVPGASQALNYAQPIYNSIGQVLAEKTISPDVIIKDAQSLAQALGTVPELKGYAKEAVADLAKVNKVVSSVESVIKAGQSGDRYKDATVKLIPWLLSGKV